MAPDRSFTALRIIAWTLAAPVVAALWIGRKLGLVREDW